MNKPSKISESKVTKLIKVGNSTGLVLSKELLTHLRVGLGDEVYLSETPNGFQLTAHNPDFAKKMDMAEQIMREDRDILHVLSK